MSRPGPREVVGSTSLSRAVRCTRALQQAADQLSRLSQGGGVAAPRLASGAAGPGPVGPADRPMPESPHGGLSPLLKGKSEGRQKCQSGGEAGGVDQEGVTGPIVSLAVSRHWQPMVWGAACNGSIVAAEVSTAPTLDDADQPLGVGSTRPCGVQGEPAVICCSHHSYRSVSRPTRPTQPNSAELKQGPLEGIATRGRQL